MTERDGDPPIVNAAGPEWSGTDDDGGRWKRLGEFAGGSRLGCTLEEIQPGGQPAAYHYHLANEEALFVLEGEGRLRTPKGTFPIETGDYVAFPAGNSGAHAVENPSATVLRCLFVSTMREPDVVVYPDEGTFHVNGEGTPRRRTDDGSVTGAFAFDAAATDDGLP